MFIICDRNDVVQDVASKETNLSRGYSFPDYKLWTDVKELDFIIGDTFKDAILTINQELRNEQLQAAANEQAIRQKLRDFAITELTKDGQWPAQV